MTFDNIALEKNAFGAKKGSLAEWEQNNEPNSPLNQVTSMNETPNKNEQHTRPRVVKSKPGSGNIKRKSTSRKNPTGRPSGSKTINQDLGIKELKRKSPEAPKDNFAVVKKNLRRS